MTDLPVVPPPALLRASQTLAVRVNALAACLVMAVALMQALTAWRPGSPVAFDWHRPYLGAALLLAFATLLAAAAATCLVTAARLAPPPLTTPSAVPLSVRRRRRLRSPFRPSSLPQAAYGLQAVVIALIMLPIGALILLTMLPAVDRPAIAASDGATSAAWQLALVFLGLCFPLLVVERTLRGRNAAGLPEAAGLRALVLNAMLALAASAVTSLLTAQAMPFADWPARISLLLSAAIAIELLARSVARLFLPAPEPADAVAVVRSTLAAILVEGTLSGNLAAPVRDQLGLDFSRSWALGFVRAASLPVLALLLLVAWGLSGLAIVGVGERGIYERFGAPVAVLQPGAHLLLPWPLGKLRRWEHDQVHELSLVAGTMNVAPAQPVAADDPAPPSADRLWEQAHPEEVSFLIASDSATSGPDAARRQNFQLVSADIRLLYRFGGSDIEVLAAAYRLNDPDALIRGIAGRELALYLAGRTLDRVLGDDRAAMAATLRRRVQAELDRIGTGVTIIDMVIQAIHPPAGAAASYHAVQAAQISAETTISTERGLALATMSGSHQYATTMVTQAEAASAETVGKAREDATRFAAERAGSAAGARAFAVERRLAAFSASLGNAALTIVDHRLPAADGAALDLRPAGQSAKGQDNGAE